MRRRRVNARQFTPQGPRDGNDFTHCREVSLIAGNVNARRLITLIYVVILGGLGEAETRLAEQERTLERLRTDKDYVARLVRQKLHYAKPGEVIFRFED